MTAIAVFQPYAVEDITVQFVDDDGELLGCNHAGAEYQDMEFSNEKTEETLTCDKCGAWYNDLDDRWMN